MKDFKVIAEIGCTHIGNLERAKKLAKLAKIAGADYIKTQKRNPKESVPKSLWNKPHPNEIFAYGKTYLEHRENLELSIEQHQELKNYCENIDIGYSTSVWDMTSTEEIIKLHPDFIKIPSACNHNYEMIYKLINNYTGEIHISLGMTTKDEREKLIKEFFDHKKRIILYHCTSGYPVPFEKMYLNEIYHCVTAFGRAGFSNHGFGIAMEPVAYSMGARYFERHFIDDRTFRHTDASASLETPGLNKLCRDLKAISKTLKFKPKEIDEIELEQRNKLRTN